MLDSENCRHAGYTIGSVGEDNRHCILREEMLVMSDCSLLTGSDSSRNVLFVYYTYQATSSCKRLLHIDPVSCLETSLEQCEGIGWACGLKVPGSNAGWSLLPFSTVGLHLQNALEFATHAL